MEGRYFNAWIEWQSFDSEMQVTIKLGQPGVNEYDDIFHYIKDESELEELKTNQPWKIIKYIEM